MTKRFDSRIQEIISDAAEEIAKAVRANAAAEVRGIVESRSRGRAGAGAVSATRGRRAARGLVAGDVDKVLAFIGRNPGQRSEQIRKALGVDPALLGRVLARLRASRLVRIRGDRRTTSYFSA